MDYKICAPYRYNGPHNEHLSEYNVTFDNRQSKIEKLVEFLEYEDADVPNKRVNITYTNGFDIAEHKLIAKFHDNVHVCLQDVQDIRLVKTMKDNDVKFFFCKSIAATNLVTLEMFIRLGVSSVYVADDLCYNLAAVHKICADNGVQVRCVLNEVPSTSVFRSVDIKSVFYRPEDIDLLAELFDVFEFSCGTTANYDWHKFNALYRAYFEQKSWFGDLAEIIDSVDLVLFNPAITEKYFTCKFKCNRKCAFDKNACHRCDNYLSVSALLAKKTKELKEQEK